MYDFICDSVSCIASNALQAQFVLIFVRTRENVLVEVPDFFLAGASVLLEKISGIYNESILAFLQELDGEGKDLAGFENLLGLNKLPIFALQT